MHWKALYLLTSLLNTTFYIISFDLPSSLLIFFSVTPSCLTLLFSLLTKLAVVHDFFLFFLSKYNLRAVKFTFFFWLDVQSYEL